MECKDGRQEAVLNLWFNGIEGVGAALRRRLLGHFKNIVSVYRASEQELKNVLGEGRAAANIMSDRDMGRYERELTALEERDIQVIYPGHPGYPSILSHIYNPPDILYVRGILKPADHIYRSIGIVGSRKPTVYGREMAFMFARELAKLDCSVVSGMASGIDSAAHRGALEAGGYTVAVLGCGINVTYPEENIGLYRDILAGGGAIVSEYGLSVKPHPAYFPIRNRIISGMSDGVFVVEARRESGSLITADCALEQGRQVYALPGRAFDKSSEGTNNLIKQGALCVTEPEEIVSDLTGAFFGEQVNKKEMRGYMTESEKVQSPKKSLAPMEKKVYSCLSLEPMYIDDIIRFCGIGITGVISTLYGMEEKGIIRQPIRGYYIIAV